MNQLLNRLHGGKRIGRVTIWLGSRGARFNFEDFRRYGGNAIGLAFRPFPDRHSNLNIDFYIRMK